MVSMKSRWVSLFLPVATACIVGVALRGFVAVVPRAQDAPPPAVDVRGQWVSIGPSTILQGQDPTYYNSGRIASIAVDPTDDGHWLVGVSNGGLWETRDAGRS